MPYAYFEQIYSNESYQDTFMRVGLDTKDFMVECAFQSVSFECKNRTSEIFDIGSQKCHLVDVQERQTKAGSGLDVVMTVPYESVPEYGSRALHKGPFIIINDFFDPFFQRKLFLPVNSRVRIELQKTSVHLINHEKNNPPQRCYAKPKAFKMYDTYYTEDACHADCLQSAILDNCTCFLPIDQKFIRHEYNNTEICNPAAMQECVKPLLKQFQGSASAMRQSGSMSDMPEADENQKDYYA